LFDSLIPNEKQRTGKNSVEYVKDQYEKIVPDSCVLKDSSGNLKLYGLPMAIDTLALYINNNAVQKAIQNLVEKNRIDNTMSQTQLAEITKMLQTPPKTWAQLKEMVPYLTTRDGDRITQSAIALGTAANVERSADILQTMMLQNGTQMTSADQNQAAFNLSVSEAGSAKSSSIPGQRALDFYLGFSNPQSSLYTWNSKMPNSVKAFEQDQVAMIIHYADLYRYLITENKSMLTSVDVQPLPQITDPSSPLAAGQTKAMAKMQVEVASSAKGDAKKQKASWLFIHFITSKTGSTNYLTEMKLASPLKEGSGRSKFTAFETEKAWATTWYKGIKAQTVDEYFISMIESAANKKKTSKEALDQAAKDTSTILSGSKIKLPNMVQ
jgi:ABC-type glycerol-3-phosphate transport system substrate-binding protein